MVYLPDWALLCYNHGMPIRAFIMMALVCAVQTLLFTEALMADQILATLLWGILLGRNLLRVYWIDRFSRVFQSPKK